MPLNEEQIERIDIIRNFPAELEALVSHLTDEQLTTHYLEGEWTVAQNVHHLADSHMNSIIRLKLILTEDEPFLKDYIQDEWAELPDANHALIHQSLMLLNGLHQRWATIFENVADEDWQRFGMHETNGKMTVDDLLRIYANHCAAHIDQIKRTLAAQSQ